MLEAGPFRIILSELEQSSPDVLGNPYAERSSAELARLFNLDEQMASSIINAVPIVVLDGLSGRVAGIVRERLAGLLRAGCRIITTDDPSDSIPRVNWPELPAIAHVSEEHDRSSGGSPGSNGAGGFRCPCCGAGLRLTAAAGEPVSTGSGAALRRDPVSTSGPALRRDPVSTSGPALRRDPVSTGSGAALRPDPSSETRASYSLAASAPPVAPPPAPAPGPDPVPVATDEDDWMNPPVGNQLTQRTASGVSQPTARKSSGRFDDASLLAYRRAEAAPVAVPPPVYSPPPPPPAAKPELQVSFTESSIEELAAEPVVAPSGSRDPFDAPPADPFDPAASDPFLESAVDPFAKDLAGPAPISHGESSFEATGSLHDSGSDILELDAPSPTRRSRDLGDDLFDAAPPSRGARKPSMESLDDLELLSDSVDQPQGRPRRSGAGDRDLLDDSQADAGAAPDLDEVLSMFGPEDEQPLDDMSGLEPKPLDLSPSRRRSSGGGDPFGEDLSDILEPLNPSEAMEIIKSQKGRSRSGAGRNRASLGPLDQDEESVDIFTDSSKPKRSKRKKTRGVPFSASDEDLALFEESHAAAPPRRASKSKRKKTDPFARARRAIEQKDPSGSSRKSQGATRNGRSRPSRKASSRRVSNAPKGDGEHGLVLSRIADPDKKEKAAELIAEIKGCSIESAHRLTDRTIIPVLKGVTRDVAEFHLEKFKRYKIAGRVTTRQRS